MERAPPPALSKGAWVGPLPRGPLIEALPAAFSLSGPSGAPLVSRLLEPIDLQAYLSFVHGSPSHGSPLLVGGVLEPLSSTPWWLVPLLWLPLCVAMAAPFLASIAAVPAAIALCALGAFCWSLVEYALHRFVFHADEALPPIVGAMLLHFLLHGVHHAYPRDGGRLVMPPILSMPLAAAFYALTRPLFTQLLPPPLTFTLPAYHLVFAAGCASYVFYDVW